MNSGVTLKRTQWQDLALSPDGWPMVRIPSGRFRGLGDASYAETRPEYDAVTDGFWIHVFPVTVSALARCVDSGEWAKRAVSSVDIRPDELLARLSRAAPRTGPFAASVSFFEANLYAQAHGLRLPNESEWEIALRAQAWTTTGGVQALAHLGFHQLTSVLGLGFSPMGCAVTVDRLAEWTADAWTDGYAPRGGLVRSCRDWLPPEVQLRTRLAVRGRAVLRAPSPVLRQALEAERTHLVDGFLVGFRCAIVASEVVLD